MALRGNLVWTRLCLSPKLSYVRLNLFSQRSFSSETTATINLPDFKLYKLDSGPKCEVNCDKSQALGYLETMMKIRHMENACAGLYREKSIRGFCHLYTGQEAVAVGTEAAVKQGDVLITAYRCHGMMLTRGASVQSVISELVGRKGGASKGNGGSMHMFYKDFLGGNGIVGAQVPIGVGAALAMRNKNMENVSIAIYGDGAANQGQVFEAFNMAKLWNLPVIFLCENNKYALGTSAERSTANTDYHTRASYIPGLWVDGMNILAVREAMSFARNWCVSKQGPILVEAETYRYFGHSMSDPGTSYRTRDEVDNVRKTKDPISMFSNLVVQSGLCTEEEVKALDKRVKALVNEAKNNSLADSEPDLTQAYMNILSRPFEAEKIRGCDILTWGSATV